LWRTKELKLVASLMGVLSLLLIYRTIPSFFHFANVINLLRQVAINGIIASGMTIVMIGGGFDLSVGAVLALSGIVSIQLAKTNVWFGMLCPLGLGAGVGLVNGILVSRCAINPLIATLGSRYLVYASANLLTAGFIQYNENPAFLTLGRSSLGGVPTPVIVFLSVALISHLMLNHTTIGAALFGVGSNERAAFFSRFFLWITFPKSSCAELRSHWNRCRTGGSATRFPAWRGCARCR
jgi:ribose transport system permease protein